MKFLCRMQVKFPESMSKEEIAEKQAAEKEYSQALQRSGEFEAIYRVVGRYANVSIFEVESSERLHEILSGFPMFPYMDIETTALCQHPELHPLSSSRRRGDASVVEYLDANRLQPVEARTVNSLSWIQNLRDTPVGSSQRSRT